MTYGSELTNSTSVLEAIRDSRLRGYLVDKSVPWDAVDLPLVTALPIRPKDRAEVNLLVDSTNEVVVRMVYRAATANWVQIGQSPTVTALPSIPTSVDGVEVYYVADSTNSIVWHLRYRSASASAYKWEYVGGTPMRDQNTGTPSTFTSTTYIDLSIAGPSITAPLAGDYRVEWWAQAQNDTVGAVCFMAVKNGAAATADANSVRGQTPVANHDIKIPTGSQEITVTAAATVLKVQYRNSAGTTTVNNHGGVGPWMTLIPVRVA